MREWTEQEEQEMIELAKQGDPKANYELSQWALQRAEEEPDEARWNRLAAKCLVKAAQAGYPPAKARMAQLLRQAHDEEKAAQSPPEEQAAPREPVRLSDARAAAARRSQSPAPESTARRPSRRREEPDETDEDGGYYDRGGRAGGVRAVYDQQNDGYAGKPDGDYGDKSAGGMFSGWGEKQWRRVEVICIAVCAVLLVLIAVMIITGHKSSGTDAGTTTSAIPAAGLTGTTASPSPEPERYPDDATLAAIQAAELDVYPADTDYVSVPTTATVKVDSQTLRLRKGPSTTYTPPICNMEDGAVVDVYAKKNNWSLVRYESGEGGTVYGWCSSEYLIVTAGSADTSSVG